jgi:tRNA dimethylallyltransferase
VEDLVSDPLLIVLVGPTGSGKTALSLALAQQLGGEIVSCDSVSIYREMEIGTAKPTQAERNLVPHHMLDVASPAEIYTAGDYSRDARKVLSEIVARNSVPIVAGGTGLYLRALLEGLSPVPARDEALRDRLRESAARHGTTYLHRLLTRLDAQAAARIHTNDIPKLIRALEVSLLERRPMSARWSEQPPQPLTGYRVVQIGLNPPREALYVHLNKRAAQMFSDGLMEETQQLVERYGHDCRALTALGYAQALAELDGAISREEAVAAAQQGHRNYAKRQLTWFRKDASIHWMEDFGNDVVERALAIFTLPPNLLREVG